MDDPELRADLRGRDPAHRAAAADRVVQGRVPAGVRDRVVAVLGAEPALGGVVRAALAARTSLGRTGALARAPDVGRGDEEERPAVLILDEDVLRAHVGLDLDALRRIEDAFAALARGEA